MATQVENNQLHYMSQEIESLKTEVSEMKALLKDVYTLLAGNPIDKESSGLLSDFKEVKKEVYILKTEVKKYKAYFYALLTLVAMGALKAIVDVLTDK